MAPGIFRLRTACCTFVIPVRLALCLPLLICTLDAYSPPAALQPAGALPLILNGTHELPGAGGDGDGRPVPAYIALRPAPPPPPPAQMGRVLTLAFVIAAAVLSVIGILALWWSGDPAGDADDVTLVEDERTCRSHLGSVFLGTATRLLLGALGTAAMAQVIGERAAIKRGSFIAIEVLGWLLV